MQNRFQHRFVLFGTRGISQHSQQTGNDRGPQRDQFGHSYREPRTFRRFFLDSLKRVSAVYPDAKLKVSNAGILLLPSRPHLANVKAPSTR